MADHNQRNGTSNNHPFSKKRRTQKAFGELPKNIKELQRLLRSFEPSAGSLPHLHGIDIGYKELEMYGAFGGDHVQSINFDYRFNLDYLIEEAEREGRTHVAKELKLNKQRGGLCIFDVEGHDPLNCVVTLQLHQMIFMGLEYEIRMTGQLTAGLIEYVNKRLYETTSIKKTVTLLIGEIWETGKFRFILAGHPNPLIYSPTEKNFINIDAKYEGSVPLGMQPLPTYLGKQFNGAMGEKKPYAVNEINLQKGQIMLLYTDGLTDHAKILKKKENEIQHPYYPGHLLDFLDENHTLPAQELADRLEKDILSFAPLVDDTSYWIVKVL
jgi:serine phosphatase RsbU (regulator of sigma subunit)